MFSSLSSRVSPGGRLYTTMPDAQGPRNSVQMHRCTTLGEDLGLIANCGHHPRRVSADEAVKCIKSNDRVFIHSVAAAPRLLIEAMVARHNELRNVEVCHIHTEQPALYADPKYINSFRNNNFFCSSNVRGAVNEKLAGYVPIFLSEVPLLFKRNILPLDVAMLQLSPPDKHGYCSMGTSVDVSVAAAECAKTILAQINPNHPRTHGEGFVHISCLDAVVDCEDPIPTVKERPITESERLIAKNISGLVPNEATLQLGIGNIPNAVLSELTNHRDLGIHSEMIADGVIDLLEKGVINNSKKGINRHVTTVGFVMGSKRLYDYLDDNPAIQFRRMEHVNDPSIIRQNPNMIAINSCIELDLTGQIVSDSIGSRIYSGVGGQVDFIRGSALSEGGKPIIAVQSLTNKGVSRIVPFINQGAGVVTTRAHAHYVVTEYGVAYLYGANLFQRAKRLIKIAHPDHREALEKAAYNQYWNVWDE